MPQFIAAKRSDMKIHTYKYVNHNIILYYLSKDKRENSTRYL